MREDPLQARDEEDREGEREERVHGPDPEERDPAGGLHVRAVDDVVDVRVEVGVLAGPEVRLVDVPEQEPEQDAEHEADQVVPEELHEAAAAARVPALGVAAAPPARRRLLVALPRRRAAGPPVALQRPAGRGVEGDEVPHAGAAHAAGEAPQGDPAEGAGPDEVHRHLDERDRHAGAVDVAGVRAVRADADVVLDPREAAHADAAREELRALEAHDVDHELELVRAAAGHHGEEVEEEEDHPQPEVGQHGEAGQQPEQRVLELAEDGQVVGEEVVEELCPPPLRRAARRLLAQRAQDLDVVLDPPQRRLLGVVVSHLHRDRDVVPQHVHEPPDPDPEAVRHVRVADHGLLDDLPQGHEQLRPHGRGDVEELLLGLRRHLAVGPARLLRDVEARGLEGIHVHVVLLLDEVLERLPQQLVLALLGGLVGPLQLRQRAVLPARRSLLDVVQHAGHASASIGEHRRNPPACCACSQQWS
mmetsp:Transcript_109227/g.309010  ORF Transcript_109227/g.309010 Transcript_109227/m.309010 type:complete len:476 (-) Transcript_109227:29-1456(-)